MTETEPGSRYGAFSVFQGFVQGTSYVHGLHETTKNKRAAPPASTHPECDFSFVRRHRPGYPHKVPSLGYSQINCIPPTGFQSRQVNNDSIASIAFLSFVPTLSGTP